MSSTEIARVDRGSVMPLPVVVDADVLSRSLDYALCKGYAPAVVGKASAYYSNFSGVVVFVTERVLDETIRRFPEIAADRGVSRETVERVWDALFVRQVRVVDVDPSCVNDWRVDDVRSLQLPGSGPAWRRCALLGLGVDLGRHVTASTDGTARVHDPAARAGF